MSSGQHILLDVGGDTIFRDYRLVNNEDRAEQLRAVKRAAGAMIVVVEVDVEQHRARFLSTKDRTAEEFPPVAEAWAFARQWWESIADVVLDVTDLTPYEAADAVANRLRRQ